MKNLLAGGIALVCLAFLAACQNGAVSPTACANAQKGVAVAEAAIAAYPDQADIPEALTANLATAKAALPLFCPAPTTVVVEG